MPTIELGLGARSLATHSRSRLYVEPDTASGVGMPGHCCGSQTNQHEGRIGRHQACQSIVKDAAMMSMFSQLDLSPWIVAYGYWAVLVLVGLESMGLPLPGETALIAAAVYAGTSGELNIVGVVAAAAAGAVIGDNIGYAIGRLIGFPVLRRYGPRIGLDEQRLRLGQYLFRRYGGAIVFFGRFVALLRTFAALLAGANRMPWPRFLFYNAAGGLVWSCIFGVGGYVLGSSVHRISGPVKIGLFMLALTAAIAAVAFMRRHEQAMLLKAERTLPALPAK
jgi:membrane protein DedA with SNARE-associated domain